MVIRRRAAREPHLVKFTAVYECTGLFGYGLALTNSSTGLPTLPCPSCRHSCPRTLGQLDFPLSSCPPPLRARLTRTSRVSYAHKPRLLRAFRLSPPLSASLGAQRAPRRRVLLYRQRTARYASVTILLDNRFGE
eukprot:3430316-Pyramimonas_sp.AAC.1